MAFRFIVMTTGYVENASTAFLAYQCEFFGNSGYDNYKDAITDLALDMYAKFYDEHLSTYQNRYSSEVRDCCRNSLIANKDAEFCSKCGDRIVNKKFDADAFMEHISNLMGSTCDSYGNAEQTSTRDMTWWPYGSNFIGAPKEDIIHLAENGEVILLLALLDAKPELRSDQDDETLEITFEHWEKFKGGINPFANSI